MSEILDGRSNVTLLTEAPVGRILNSKNPKGENQVEVTYLQQDSSGKQRPHHVTSHYLVYSAQLKIAPTLIQGFKDAPEKRTRDQAALMSQMGYSHYSVHNIKVKGHPYRLTYDTWTRGTDYTEDDFTDIILGRWMELKGYDGFKDFTQDPQGDGIMTIYHPLSQKWIGKGYTEKQAAEIANSAANRMLELYSPMLKALDPESAKNSEKTDLKMLKIKTSRWPFSVHIAKPGHFITDAKILRQPFGNIFFGNNNLGTPAFEEALFRGHCAANNILARMSPQFKNEPWSRCPLDK